MDRIPILGMHSLLREQRMSPRRRRTVCTSYQEVQAAAGDGLAGDNLAVDCLAIRLTSSAAMRLPQSSFRRSSRFRRILLFLLCMSNGRVDKDFSDVYAQAEQQNTSKCYQGPFYP